MNKAEVGAGRARPANRVAGPVGDLGAHGQLVTELVRDRERSLPDVAVCRRRG